VQLEECGYAISVRTADELEGLAFEHRRSVFMVCQLRGRVHNVLDANQPINDYWCVSAEASFSACFAADLLSVELIVGLSV